MQVLGVAGALSQRVHFSFVGWQCVSIETLIKQQNGRIRVKGSLLSGFRRTCSLLSPIDISSCQKGVEVLKYGKSTKNFLHSIL